MLLEIILFLFLFLILFYFFFQREPRIRLDPDISDNIILAPSYGKIYGIFEENEKIHIIIILNLFDIHTQYYPMNGTVINQIHDKNGKYELVYRIQKSRWNEKVITTINTMYGNVTVQQIAGMFVRNISTTLDKIPQDVRIGRKLGNILFGSRVDLILPKNNLELFVTEGQTVQGPHTIIGQYK
jgi:phosphatidylserine decarboxylase